MDNSNSPPSRPLIRRKPVLLALEGRMMFDGAAVATAVAVDANPAPMASNGESAQVADGKHDILFIDTTVANWQQLADAANPNINKVILDPTTDALHQIADALRGQSNLDAIHIISHGAEGNLIIGGQTYNADNLGKYQSDLSSIGNALSENGDILLYGCDIGAGVTGASFLTALADATHADIEASTDMTGSAAMNADWVMEASVGDINTSLFASAQSLALYQDRLSTVSLSGSAGWIPVMFGSGKDPQGDSQAGAADTDVVGDASHGSLYMAFDDNGTLTTADDTIAFRLRIDNPTSTTNFGGVAVVGIDANLDGRIDLFMAVDGRNNGQAIRLLDPGTGANISPNTTTTSPLPIGWLPNNGVYAFSATNYSVVAVSSASDSNWTGNTDLGGGGDPDAFVSWKIPLADMATVLAKPSPTDRNGAVGPRGATGIAGFNADTTVRFISFTQTQNGPINGDLNGVGGSYDKNATFASLGTFTNPMSASNPIADTTSIKITGPISDGMLNDAEDNSVAISGTATSANGSSVTLTVSDGTNTLTFTNVTTVSGGNWSVNGLNLSALNDGALSVTASVTAGGISAQDITTVDHDKTHPVIAVTAGASATNSTPTISGTTDLPQGSVLTVTIDPDNDSVTLNNIVYLATIQTGGLWSINTAVAVPSSGSFPVSGLTAYSKISATGTDAAGNATTADALNPPTVNTLTTNSINPTITGTWTNIAGDTLSVTVNGVTYTAGSGLTINGHSWSVTPTLTSGTYNVAATVTRSGGGSVTDATTNELVVAAADPSISITGGATASGSDTTPVISGATSLPNGSFVTIRIDPNNDGNLSDAVYYTATVSGGNWSVDTGTATPISGTFPYAGITGASAIYVTAVNADGNQASASQTLTVSIPTIAISSVETTLANGSSDTTAIVIIGDNILNAREDNSVSVSGTSTNAVGQTVTATITDGTTTKTATGTVAAGGSWTVTFSAANSNIMEGLKDGTLSVNASVSTATAGTTVTHDASAPILALTASSSLDKTNPTFTVESDLATSSTISLTRADTSATISMIYDSVNKRWTGQFGSGNNFSVGTTNITISSAATDAAGNKAASVTRAEGFVNNISGVPTITITGITGWADGGADPTIVTSEIGSGVTVTGTSSTTSGTVSVSVTDGTTTLNFTPATNGNWSVTLSQAQVQGFKNGPLSFTASVTTTYTAYDVEIPSLALNAAGTGSISINKPIDNGVLNATEDDNVVISGTTVGAVGGTVTVTFSDGDSATVDPTATATVAANGTWTATAVNLSALNNGAITVTATVDPDNNAGTNNSVTDTTSVFHDKTPPVISVVNGASSITTTPVISGTSDLPAGTVLTVTVDPDNNASTNNNLTYNATVQGGAPNTWTVDTRTATPTSGTFPTAGLTSYSKITVSGSDAAGNTTTSISLNRPTIISQVTNNSTPTLTGAWTNIAGDSLSVTVNGVTYTTGTSPGLFIIGNTWSLTPNALPQGTYNILLTVTRTSPSTSITDNTTNELVVDTTQPNVTITSGGGGDTAITGDSTPVISGTTDLADGSTITITLDPDNNAATVNNIIYQTIVSGSTWSIDTGTATPVSGIFPAANLNGPVGVTAVGSDAAGNSGADIQILTVDVTPPIISITSNAQTPDTTPVINGTTDLPTGDIITIIIDTDNVPGGTTYTYTATVQPGGLWSIDTGTDIPSGQGGPVTYTNGNTIGVKATGTDSVGNTTTTEKAVLINTNAPSITIADPVGGIGIDGVANAAEDNAITISGSTTNIANGEVLVITITDGATTVVDSATVNGNAWTLSAIDLSSLKDGLISISATYTTGGGDVFLGIGSFIHDKTSPTVTLTSAASSPISGATTVTATFSENIDAATLSASDFATSNGAIISNLVQVNPTTWTFTLTPAVAGAVSVWLPENVAKDLAGNDNALSSALNFTSNVATPDTIAPTISSIVRQTPTNALTNADSTTFRITFSEPVNNLDASDFSVTLGGSVASVTAVNGQVGVYDVVINNITNANGVLTLSLLGGQNITDQAASPNALVNTTPALNETYTLDNILPTLAAGNAIVINGDTIIISYNDISGLGSSTPSASDFTVTKNGSVPLSVINVSVNPNTNQVVLTLSSAVIDQDAVTVSYLPGATAKIQDLAGNNATAFNAVTALNQSPDTTAPTLTSIDDGDGDNIVTVGDVLTYTVTFNEDIDDTTVTAADFENAGTAGISIGAISEISPGVFTVMVTTNSTGTLILQVKAGAVIEDVSGNVLDASSALPDNTTVTVGAVPPPVDTTPPTLVDIDDGDADNNITEGDTLTYTVTFSEGMDGTSVTAADFGNDGTAGISIGTITQLSSDVFTVQVTANTTGSLILRVNSGAVIKDLSGNNLNTSSALPDDTTVTVNSALPPADITPPTLSDIDDGDADNIVTAGDTLTYTVTFDEDIDGATVTSADFGNDGTSSMTIGTVTEISPGVFTVEVTPTTAGTLILKINSGAVIKDIAGNNMDTSVALVDDATITVNPPPDVSPPTLVSIDDGDADNTINVGNTLTYVVTFSEDIDSTTVTAADFSNDGTASITIGTITEISPGVFTVGVTANSTGSLILKVNSGAVINDIAGNSLDTSAALPDDTTVTVNAAPDIAPPIVSDIDDGDADNVVITGDTLTYTISFNEDIDGTTVTATDFSNAGTATITIGTITEVSPGVFMVAVTADTDGTLILQINSGAVIKDIAGNDLDTSSALPDNTTVTVIVPDTTAPILTSIDDGDADDVVNEGDTLSYTVTFDEDIDGTTVTAADFGNSGTAGITIGAITEVSPGVFSVAVTANTAGTLNLQINVGAIIKDVAGNNLDTTSTLPDDTTLTVNAVPDTTAPTLTSIDDGDGDNIVTVGDVLTYTVTFNEDIDDTTVTAADFENVGTAGISIGSISEISPGVFTVVLTTNSTGTLILQVKAGAVIEDVSGNVLDASSALPDNTTVTVNDIASPPIAPPNVPPPLPTPTVSEIPPPILPEGILESPVNAPIIQPISTMLSQIHALTPYAFILNSYMNDMDRIAPDSLNSDDFDSSRIGNDLWLPANDIFTSSGEGAFRITVIKGADPSLTVFRGVPDEVFSSQLFDFRVPVDAFVHTDDQALVYLKATLSDGSPLPEWLEFDATTGQFEGKPPAGLKEVAVKIEAYDQEGRHASTVFRMKFTAERRSDARDSFSDKLHQAGGSKSSFTFANSIGTMDR